MTDYSNSSIHQKWLNWHGLKKSKQTIVCTMLKFKKKNILGIF